MTEFMFILIGCSLVFILAGIFSILCDLDKKLSSLDTRFSRISKKMKRYKNDK